MQTKPFRLFFCIEANVLDGGYKRLSIGMPGDVNHIARKIHLSILHARNRKKGLLNRGSAV